MTLKRDSNPFLLNFTIGILLVALAIRAGASYEWIKPSRDPQFLLLNELQSSFPQANTYHFDKHQVIHLQDSLGKTIASGLISSHFKTSQEGYGGKVPLFIEINKGRIQQIHLLRHSETKEYIDHLNDVHFLKSWNNLNVENSVLRHQVDAVTGATYSSEAIIGGVNETFAQYFSIKAANKIKWQRVLQISLTILLLISGITQLFLKTTKKLYFWHLLFVLLIMGLWTKKMLSAELFYSYIKTGPSTSSHIELTIILFATIALQLMGKKSFYCTYLCPMGALQVFSSKLSPFKKRSFPKKVLSIELRLIYLTFIWSCLILGISLPLYNLEPFMAFSFKVAGGLMIGSGGLIILLSLFFNRPWCHLCPTGCALNTIQSLKRKASGL